MSEYSSSMEATPMASSMIFRIGALELGRKGWSNVAIGILYRGRFPTTDNPSPEEIISFIIGSDDPTFMLPSVWEVTTAVLLGIVSFPASLALTRFFMKVNAKRGIVGIDVHKLSKPRIVEMCGASIPITLILLSATYVLIGGGNSLMMLAFSLVVGSAAVVGALDDRLRMRGIYKPLLTLLCGLPIVALGLLYPNQVYNPTLQVPIFGVFHLPVIYLLSIPVAISVTSNTTNMLDDGRLASTSDPNAPLTLVRTLLVSRPAKESEIVSTIFTLYLISGVLALITMILIG